MRPIISVILLTLLTGQGSIAQTNSKHIWVDTYSKDGKLIQGHYRTSPNKTNRDNFSTKGNVNPYTKEPGWITPDNIPILNPDYTYKIDTSTKFDTTIDDCSGYFFGNLRIGQFQRILNSYKKTQRVDDTDIYEIKSTADYSVLIALNPNGFMLGYIIETSNYDVALQVLQNFTNYHSLPIYNDENGVIWLSDDYNIVYVKLGGNSQKIKPNGKYRFSVSKIN